MSVSPVAGTVLTARDRKPLRSSLNIGSSHGGKARRPPVRRSSGVRDLTGAAIASRRSFAYGRFAADLCVPSGSGLVTGLFLHRNGPRQEIDIEIIGQDTTRMLVNVFYNPGIAGTKLEYGYRGTPVLIDQEGTEASEACFDNGIPPRIVELLLIGVDDHVAGSVRPDGNKRFCDG